MSRWWWIALFISVAVCLSAAVSHDDLPPGHSEDEHDEDPEDQLDQQDSDREETEEDEEKEETDDDKNEDDEDDEGDEEDGEDESQGDEEDETHNTNIEHDAFLGKFPLRKWKKCPRWYSLIWNWAI